jgi:hypothetical protein
MRHFAKLLNLEKSICNILLLCSNTFELNSVKHKFSISQDNINMNNICIYPNVLEPRHNHINFHVSNLLKTYNPDIVIDIGNYKSNNFEDETLIVVSDIIKGNSENINIIKTDSSLKNIALSSKYYDNVSVMNVYEHPDSDTIFKSKSIPIVADVTNANEIPYLVMRHTQRNKYDKVKQEKLYDTIYELCNTLSFMF